MKRILAASIGLGLVLVGGAFALADTSYTVKSMADLLTQFQRCQEQALPEGCLTPAKIRDIIGSIPTVAGNGKAPAAGPATTAAGNIATYDNTTGTLLADAGVPLAALTAGPIINAASPLFAGGMKCDGTTNDTAALAAVVTAANAAPRAIVNLPAGICKLNTLAAAMTLTQGVRFQGAGHPKADTYASMLTAGLQGTILTIPSSYANGDVFLCSSRNPCIFRDLMFDSPVQRTGGAYIVAGVSSISPADANRDIQISGVLYHNGYIDYRQDFGVFPRLDNNVHMDFAKYGDYIKNNATGADYGDGSFTRNMYWELDNALGTCDAGLYAEATGLFNVSQNKFNGCKRGSWINLTVGPTGTAIITNNSFENQTVNGASVTQSVSGAEYGMVNWSHNEVLNFTAPTLGAGLYVGTGTPTTLPKWVRQITAIGNQIAGTYASATPQININDGIGITVVGNSCDGISANVFPCVGGTAMSGGATNRVVSALNQAYSGATMPDLATQIFQGSNTGVRLESVPGVVHLDCTDETGFSYKQCDFGGSSVHFRISGSDVGNIAAGGALTMSGLATFGSLATVGSSTLGTVSATSLATGSLSSTGHVLVTGPNPTIASGFGTTPAIAGSDTAGRVTVGSGGAASGIITFGSAFGVAPACVAQDETTSNLMRPTATTTQLTITGTMVAADKIVFHCIAY